jgi:hypothetical protein
MPIGSFLTFFAEQGAKIRFSTAKEAKMSGSADEIQAGHYGLGIRMLHDENGKILSPLWVFVSPWPRYGIIIRIIE